jgi:hypothetical protein
MTSLPFGMVVSVRSVEIENPWVAAAAGSWSPATGPAKPCASTKPIGLRLFAKLSTRPGF